MILPPSQRKTSAIDASHPAVKFLIAETNLKFSFIAQLQESKFMDFRKGGEEYWAAGWKTGA